MGIGCPALKPFHTGSDMKRDDSPIIVEQVFDRSVSDVWSSIVEIEEMRKWYFENIPDFKAEVGFSTQFLVKTEEREFLHLWEIIEVVPQSKVVYSWRYKGIVGDSIASFEVSGNDDSALLTVTLQALQDFPSDIPEFTRESCIAGWNYFIKDRLKTYLDG
jgi:uncharacterized protein YndB with AHSA1/START domain